MSKRGWVVIDRKLVKSDFWLSETFTKPQAWVDLIINANHKPGRFWIQGVEIKLERGQIGWSKRTMAERWGWSRGKVKRFLNWLEKDQKIIQQTVQRKTTIITLVNYDKYQPNGTTDKATDGPPTGHRRTINNNDNNDNNINIYVSKFNELFNRQFRVTTGRTKKLKARLKVFKFEQIMVALENLAASDFHQGKNDRNWQADPDFLLRSDEQIDKWLNRTPKKKKKTIKLNI